MGDIPSGIYIGLYLFKILGPVAIAGLIISSISFFVIKNRLPKIYKIIEKTSSFIWSFLALTIITAFVFSMIFPYTYGWNTNIFMLMLITNTILGLGLTFSKEIYNHFKK